MGYQDMLWDTQQPTSCQHGPTPLRQSSRRAPSPRTRFHNCHRLKIIIANSQKQLPPSEKMFNEQREKKKSYMPVRCKTPARRLALCPARGEGRSPPCLHFVPLTQSNTLKGSFPKNWVANFIFSIASMCCIADFGQRVQKRPKLGFKFCPWGPRLAAPRSDDQYKGPMICRYKDHLIRQ